MTVFYALDILLRVFFALSPSILMTTQGVGYFIVSILKMMKLRLTEFKRLAQSHKLVSVRARI